MDSSTIAKILKFRDDRSWKQFHTPRDLAISITLEAAELLEKFQWNPSDEDIIANKEKIAEEIADVLIYCAYLSDTLDLDINQIISDKIDKNSMKYPIEKSFGNSKKYSELGD
jgi:NTP pyrophosphatase (non-canonical NTP hydrolase)